MMNIKKTWVLVFLALVVFVPWQAKADDQFQPQTTTVKAKVMEVISQGEENNNPFYGDGAGETATKDSPTQVISARILEGNNAGTTVQFTNDYVMLKAGDDFYLNETSQPDGTVSYTVNAPYRINFLLFLLCVFLLLVVLFGGAQGTRGLLSLAGSLVLIVFVLIPSILHGFSPIIASLAVALVIIVAGSYITHGFNKTTTVAVLGMIITVALVGAMTYYAINASHLTGAEENAIYLNINSQNNIDLVGLLFGGIMIGLLGVLYDVAIGQAVSVEELHQLAPNVNRWVIYQKAMRIGREHIGALVGTLAIAYVGVALPLLLLYSKSSTSLLVTINQELFATEIIRILISSIGLILAVPITTLLAVYFIFKNQEGDLDHELIKKEQEALEHAGHHH